MDALSPLPLCLCLPSPTLCLSESCNIHRLQPPPASPQPSSATTSTTTAWNNQSARASRESGKDSKRVHFNLETLNTYRLQAPPSGPERGLRRGLVGSPPTQLCENGGPAPTLSLVLSPPSGSSSLSSNSASQWEGELQELQGRIEEFRGQLRAALARRAELQSSLEREKAACRVRAVMEPTTSTNTTAERPLPASATATTTISTIATTTGLVKDKDTNLRR